MGISNIYWIERYEKIHMSIYTYTVLLPHLLILPPLPLPPNPHLLRNSIQIQHLPPPSLLIIAPLHHLPSGLPPRCIVLDSITW